MRLSKKHWSILAAGAGMVAAVAARKASQATWEKLVDEKVPTLQTNPRTRKLLLWAGVSALAAAVASTGARTAVQSLRDDTGADA